MSSSPLPSNPTAPGAVSATPSPAEGAPAVPTGAGPTETFDLGDIHGELVSACRPADLETEVRRLLDPASALRTLHWGRNYIYAAQLSTAPAPEISVPVVVKQFRNEGFLQGLKRRWKGSKAQRSWRVARAFQQAGLPTAEPVMLVESRRRDGPSFFVTRDLGEVVEARYLLRAANEGREGEEFADVDFEAFLSELGALLRRMHEARFWHRDLSIGNVLLRRASGTASDTGGGRAPELFIIDLNRTRAGSVLSLSERTRDLCRLSIFRPEHQEVFLRGYWRDDPRFEARRRLYLAYQKGFLRRIETKKRMRGGFRTLRDHLRPRSTHAHIPAAPEGVSSRDKIVWDHLSDQPHQHASRSEKLWVRVADLGGHARAAGVVLAAAPRIWLRYRSLKRDLYRSPVPFDGLGVCLRPYPAAPEALLAAVEDLGVRRLLLRLHPWQDRHDEEEELARELHRRGYELAFSLPQNRQLVKEPERWRAALEELAERFFPYGRQFQVGQAINRSKWGVWNYREYLRLAQIAGEVFGDRPGRELLGPSVIDFEYHAAAAALNLRHPGVTFDAVSALLYVDRRGAPENRQTGLDTVDKVVLLKALAETARNSAGRCWITEFNWPLWEGPHSPAGRDVSVDEDSQASFLVRYYLLTLGTGLVERAYWWQIIAKGYGLVDPPAQASGETAGGRELRRRPSFAALATLARELDGASFLGPLRAPPDGRLYHFRRAGGDETVVAWSMGERASLRLPRPVQSAMGRGGEELPPPPGVEIEASPAPVYYRLAPE